MTPLERRVAVHGRDAEIAKAGPSPSMRSTPSLVKVVSVVSIGPTACQSRAVAAKSLIFVAMMKTPCEKKRRFFTTEDTEHTERRKIANSLFGFPLCSLCPLW